jgi:ABC-type multidrug transport system fused ATPase/permease subunit
MQSVNQLLSRLWRHITRRRRVQIAVILILMLFVSVAEIVSIGLVLPFLGALTAPERVYTQPILQPLIQALGISEAAQLLLPLTIAFGLSAIIAGLMRLVLLWTSTRVSYATGADLSLSIYRRTLYQPYSVHCARNSSEIINGISNKTSGVIHIINMILQLISSIIVLVFILTALLALEPYIALLAFSGFGLIYFIVIRLTRKQLLRNGERIARESTNVIKSLQEGLGGIRDVLLDGSQATYCQIYRNADLPMRRAQGNTSFINISPRYGVEALGMLLIAALAYSLAQQPDGIARAIPVLGALALGAQRLLPVLQQAYSAWSSIRGGQALMQDTLELLDQPLPSYANDTSTVALPFKQDISFNKVSFRYGLDSPLVLRDIDLTITKGSRVGFVGTTGSGKSTLLDLVMALLQPTTGTLEVDRQVITSANHRAWQSHIAHVPQAIFLADSTIAENIAFGVAKDQIDYALVKQAAEQAQIAGSIASWPKKYQTLVGERGVRLSGGQRQRIGIARALYKKADVIIFDEATSALDGETELAVMQAIESLSKDLTLLIIAHRISTLRTCSKIVVLSDGGISRVATHQEITETGLTLGNDQ